MEILYLLHLFCLMYFFAFLYFQFEKTDEDAITSSVRIRKSNRLIFPVQVRFGFNSGFKFRFSSG